MKRKKILHKFCIENVWILTTFMRHNIYNPRGCFVRESKAPNNAKKKHIRQLLTSHIYSTIQPGMLDIWFRKA